MSKKHLLFVLPTLRIGGAEKALVSLFKAMDPARYDIDLFLFEQGGELQPELPDWIRLLPENRLTRDLCLELHNYLRDLLHTGNLRAIARRLQTYTQGQLRARLHRRPKFAWRKLSGLIDALPGSYDVAIAFLEGTTSFFVLDKTTAARKISWIHTDLSNTELVPEAVSEYARFDRLVTISSLCKDSIERAIPQVRGRVELIENVVLPEDVRARAEAPVSINWDQDRIHLISVGRLEGVKGVDLAIHACRHLIDRGHRICWHVFGDGTKKEPLSRLIGEFGLQDAFILEGAVSNPLPYLKAADIFVQPSRQEGKSIALDEAKLLGKPIVVTAYSSVGDQVTDGVTGIIVPIEPESIADGIERLLMMPELRAALRRNCLELPSPHELILKKFYQLIDEDETSS